MKPEIEIGNFVIRLPDENSKQFYIFHDLAEIFGFDFQSDAVSVLKEEIRSAGDLKTQPSIDYEVDRVSIRSSSAEVIFEVAKCIESLTLEDFKANLSDQNWGKVFEKLKSWKRPKPKKWKEGDVFSLQLMDGSYAFGQVLAKHEKSWMSPSFALFDLKSEKEDIDLGLLKKSKPITILHLMATNLNNGKWKVIGSLDEVLFDPFSGPWGRNLKSGSVAMLESVANYFWFKTHIYKDESRLTELIIKKDGWLSRMRRYWS